MSALAFHQIYFHAVRYGWTLFEKKVRSKKTRLSLPTIESSLSIISHYEDTHLWPTWLLIDRQHCERHNERKDQDWFIFTFSLILIRLRYFLQKNSIGFIQSHAKLVICFADKNWKFKQPGYFSVFSDSCCSCCCCCCSRCFCCGCSWCCISLGCCGRVGLCFS